MAHLETRSVLERAQADAVNLGWLAWRVHQLNQHFYHDIATGARVERNLAELQMLMVSEISEMMEGVRKDLPDTHLPHRKMEEVEAADLLIRLLDYCGYRGLDIAGAVHEKLAYNVTRQDHTNEARRAAHGKKF